MFLSGLEIDFKAFSGSAKRGKLPSGKLEPNTFALASIIFAGIFVVSLLLSYLFVIAGFIDNAFLMTINHINHFSWRRCSNLKRSTSNENSNRANYFARGSHS